MQLSPRGEISGVPVSYRDNNGVYSAVQQITELRQTVGRVYQHQRRSPRLRVNASLTLHLCTAAFGEWPTVISLPLSGFIPYSSISSPPFFHLCSVSSSYPFLLFLPIFLTPPPPPSSVCHAVTLHPLPLVCVCVSSPSL